MRTGRRGHRRLVSSVVQLVFRALSSATRWCVDALRTLSTGPSARTVAGAKANPPRAIVANGARERWKQLLATLIGDWEGLEAFSPVASALLQPLSVQLANRQAVFRVVVRCGYALSKRPVAEHFPGSSEDWHVTGKDVTSAPGKKASTQGERMQAFRWHAAY